MTARNVDHSSELIAVVDAVRGAIDDAQRQLARARHLTDAVTALAATALRQRGLTDTQIRRHLDIDDDALTAATRYREPACDAGQTRELRADIEQLWMTVRRQASVWLQDDDVTTSAQVVERNTIGTGAWPLAVRALDTPGAEFRHQTSGQKIVVYSLQSRDGTPAIVDDNIASWDHQGEYDVEFISPDGQRSSLDLTAYGILNGVRRFRRPSERDDMMRRAFPSAAGGPAAGRDAVESFCAIIAAIRRTCGPMPPYAEVVSGMSEELTAH